MAQYIATVLRAAVLLLICALPAEAANHYVLAGGGASGSTGADWAHACNGFAGGTGSACAPNSMTRGDTYYFGTGTYAFMRMTTAVSGALVITLKGATIADHGTATGWSDAFSVSSADGSTSAHFNYSGADKCAICVDTSYWTITGSVGSTSSHDATAYGINFLGPGCPTDAFSEVQVPGAAGHVTNVTLSYMATDGCGLGDGEMVVVGCGQCFVQNLLVSHIFEAHQAGFTGPVNCSGCIYEYLDVEHNMYAGGDKENFAFAQCGSTDTCGGGGSGSPDCTSPNCSINNTIRYSNFLDFDNPGTTGCIVGIPGAGIAHVTDNLSIYGNVFNACAGGDGVIGFGVGASSYATNVKVYNNTFVNEGAGGSSTLMEQCVGAVCASAAGNEFKNNLVWNNHTGLNSGTGTAIVNDYNAYCAPADTPPTEAHGQTGCGDLFVSSGTSNFHLSVDTTAGLTLASPYDTDPDGTARGVNGTWDRGAYQIVGSGGGSVNYGLFSLHGPGQ